MWWFVGVLQSRIPFHLSSVCPPSGIRKYNFDDAAALSEKGEISCIMGHKGKWEYKIWNSVSQGTMQQHFLMEIFWFLVEIFWYLSFSQNLEIFSLKNQVENYLLFSLKFCPGKIKLSNHLCWRSQKSVSPFFDHLISCWRIEMYATGKEKL